MLESLLNKVAHVISYNHCGVFKNTYFLITPQVKQPFNVNKSHEVIARVFIGILQNIFRSWANFLFSESPKAVFWTNCTFPLKA